MQYVLGHLDMSGVDESMRKDAMFIVPPGDKWPKNNGFIRIMPLLVKILKKSAFLESAVNRNCGTDF